MSVKQAKYFDGDNTKKVWDETAQMDDEWTTDNISDMSTVRLYTLDPNTPYIKTLKFKDKDGNETSTEKSYIYADNGDRILPIRVNKYSRKELANAFGSSVRAWHKKQAVVVIDRSSKWPYIVLKPKSDKAKNPKGPV